MRSQALGRDATPLQQRTPFVLLCVAYLAAVSAVMIWRGISVSPDYLLAIMVPVALLSGRLLRFLGDWVPFIAVFLGWEAMRGIVGRSGIPPHASDLAGLETWLFRGHVPSASLQGWLDHGALGRILDYGGTVVYFCHFAVPITVGLVLWLNDRTQYLRFTTAFMGMAFVAFVIYLVAPTVPPWIAQEWGIIDGVHKITGTTLPSAVSPLYSTMNPNYVASFPSLHAAFPFLGFLALRDTYPRVAWFALAWCAVVWFSVVYLGEHYVVDVIAGVALAWASWTVLMRIVVPRVRVLQTATWTPDDAETAIAGARAASPGRVAARRGEDQEVASAPRVRQRSTMTACGRGSASVCLGRSKSRASLRSDSAVARPGRCSRSLRLRGARRSRSTPSSTSSGQTSLRRALAIRWPCWSAGCAACWAPNAWFVAMAATRYARIGLTSSQRRSWSTRDAGGCRREVRHPLAPQPREL
jgi:membrane-associated phospholipid phosphatase